jgi:hypothetical protein
MAIRLGRRTRIAQRVQSAPMLVMQEDRKLRSNGLALRRYRLLKEIILHLLGQIAPDSNNSLAKRARKLRVVGSTAPTSLHANTAAPSVISILCFAWS